MENSGAEQNVTSLWLRQMYVVIVAVPAASFGKARQDNF